jgi:hypothetical protein
VQPFKGDGYLFTTAGRYLKKQQRCLTKIAGGNDGFRRQRLIFFTKPYFQTRKC